MKPLISALLLAALAAPASALSTAQTSADGGVTLRASVSDGVVLDPGDQVSFQYQSARDAVVVVFDIDTQGYVTLLHDHPLQVRARESRRLPDGASELFVEGEPGVDFVFALAVSDPDAIDLEAFEAMRTDIRRINGDPFVAANMIAGELVRNISQHPVFMGYAYFYVSERVEYPCYLCGTCEGAAPSGECDGYQIVQDFDRGVSLSYPLSRGYQMVEVSATPETVEEPAETSIAIPDQATEVNFYPYGSEVYYADPVAVNLWYSWGWYDPFFWYYPYGYPYCYSPWSFSIGFGWGWGWGGYYCSGWYDPWYGCGYPYGPYYPSSGYPSTVSKFKSKYKSDSGAPTLAENRAFASKRDGDLRVASKSVKPAGSSTAWRSKTGSQVSKNPFTSTHRVKTSVSGSRSVTREAWAKGRTGSYNGARVYRGQRSTRNPVFQPKSTAGKSVKQRSGYYQPNSRSMVPSQRGGSSRMKSGSYSTRSRSSWTTAPRTSNRNYGTMRSAPRTGSYKGSSSPSMRGGWSGSRSMGSMRGGSGMKGGRSR